MADMLLPVGHLLGPFFTSPDAEIPESIDVRVGDAISQLSPEMYVLWVAAHGDPEQVAKRPMTESAVLAFAREQLVVDPVPFYQGMRSRGLLVPLPRQPRAQREFAQRHRVLPQVLGLGTDVDRPDQFVLGMTGRPLVHVNAPVFLTWMFGYQYATLWEVCETVGTNSDQTSGDSAEPARILTDVVAMLPLLVAAGCAYIDRRSDG